jgi:dTDP-4-amino-4,6-dideoxygalactose transaminase
MIQVTKPFLPPIDEYQQYVEQIWKRQWLTNMGPLSSELEMRLKEYLDLKHLLFVANGTAALQIAIKALELKGEIITTPFSFVATTSSIVWEGCVPVFVDIDNKSLNIDPEKIEAAITPDTSAILAAHVYGNSCDIDRIAKKHNLKVIYDGASEEFLLQLVEELNKNQIFTRRYFYPSLASALPYLTPSAFVISDDVSKRVLCLPLYPDLTIEEINPITKIILRVQNN